MMFQEIIPASDRLSSELSEVKGGIVSTSIVCDSGAVCEAGKTEPEPIIIIIEEPSGPSPFYPALG